MKIAVAGTGYVGLSIALLLSQHNEVHALDIVPKKVELLNNGKSPIVDPVITDFLKKTAHDRLLELSRQKAALIDRVVHSVSIKDTKSRWGSCSSKSNINYNWRIVLAPAHVIDYLVCHEVSHLRHQDHSPAFWDCVASLCPDYQEGRAWLKVKGKELYRYT